MRWSYKTTHFSLKKEGLLGSAFLDEAEIEVSLNEFGSAGWELVTCMEVNDGLIAVFKQPFSEGLPYIEREKDIISPQPVEVVASSLDKSEALAEDDQMKTEMDIGSESDREDVGTIKIL